MIKNSKLLYFQNEQQYIKQVNKAKQNGYIWALHLFYNDITKRQEMQYQTKRFYEKRGEVPKC